jgi:hypothetical protein
MVTINNDRKISKESNTKHLDTYKYELKLDIASHVTESLKKSRVGSKIMSIENLELDLIPIRVNDNVTKLDEAECTSFNCVKVSLELNYEIYTVSICITKSLNINDLIIKSIDEFNHLFQMKGIAVQLVLKYKDYNFKPAKKTGRSKMDYPIIEKDINVFDTGIEHFSLICAKTDVIKINNKFRCLECPIL